jgi:hypothetical protein
MSASRTKTGHFYEYVRASDLGEAKAFCPWAVAFVRAHFGFYAFESESDAYNYAEGDEIWD